MLTWLKTWINLPRLETLPPASPQGEWRGDLGPWLALPWQ